MTKSSPSQSSILQSAAAVVAIVGNVEIEFESWLLSDMSEESSELLLLLCQELFLRPRLRSRSRLDGLFWPNIEVVGGLGDLLFMVW